MAINFPSTAGQPTNGSYTYTVAGISYSWNGESWVAAGAGASATDRTLFSVTTNAASATPALTYNNNTGNFLYVPPDISDMATQTWVGSQGYLTAANQPYDSIAEGEAKVETIRTTGSPAAGDTADEITFTVGWNDADGTNSTNEVGHIDSHGRWFIGPYSGGSTTHPNALTDGTSLIISKSFDKSNSVSGVTYNYACLHLNNPSPQSASALGKIYFSGYGNAFEGASIIGDPVGAWGAFPNFRATDITINLNGYGTNGSTDTSLVERWRFKSSGALAVNGTANTGTAGQVLTSQGDAPPTWETPSTGGSARATVSATNSIAASGIANISMTTPKTYALLSIETSHAAWVTLYSDTTSRTADSSRNETTDPVAGSGVLAEVITSGSTTQLITPASICFNSATANTTYLKIVNKSGSTANVQVTLTYVSLES